jgi:PPOX class probable F420-dependent enzyme
VKVGMEFDELDAFLDRVSPALLGLVGTSFRDGSPHVVPVWYRWDGKDVRIWTHEKRGWVRNLGRDPRVAFVVAEPEPPFAAVVMYGRVEITTIDDEATALEIRRISRRYLPETEVEDYAGRWPDLRTIVRIRPDSISSWARGY